MPVILNPQYIIFVLQNVKRTFAANTLDKKETVASVCYLDVKKANQKIRTAAGYKWPGEPSP